MTDIKNNAIQSLAKLKDNLHKILSDDNDLLSKYGWNTPAIDREDICLQIDFIIKIIDNTKIELTDDDDYVFRSLSDIPLRVDKIIGNTLPYISNGNAGGAFPALFEFINWLFFSLNPLIGWVNFKHPEAMPKKIANRIDALNKRISAIEPEQKLLENKIKLINEATAAADELPESLETLQAAKKDATLAREQAERSSIRADENAQKIKNILDSLGEVEVRAKEVLEKSEQALRSSTSVGLAAAFSNRANALNASIRWWVAGLTAALLIGAIAAYYRIDFLGKIIAGDEPNWGVLIMHLLLSAMSIGGPLWFAWMATNQITYRFKLAEDYSFKSSVATAYEGYRKEAASIDENFTHRLFGSALDRLDEAPMRVMDQKISSSPLHDLLETDAFKTAVDKFPDLGKAVGDVLKKKSGSRNKGADMDSTPEKDPKDTSE